ncbi:hypothetical protein C7271_10905 [filamentous cyanobacterium CCP5]|nr:hypothetical protein C7271_10905 [filamentous cyanobacterium CCP5]
MPVVPPKDHHRHIPHDAHDSRPVSRLEKNIKFFEKHINALHSLMIQKGQLPSMDPIRRAAEEVDGIFAAQHFDSNVPDFLRRRWPEYSERRILAVEIVLCELGYLTPDELQREQIEVAPPVQIAYSPYVDEETCKIPRYAVGDWVRIRPEAKPGHIRTPVYLLGKQGRIAQIQGNFPDPEGLAHFQETVVALPLYLVEFAMAEVWGDACPPKSQHDKLRVEIYEPWLMEADPA